MTTYNYCCINDDCKGPEKKMVQINLSDEEKDEIMYCPTCDEPLKRMGQASFTVLGSKAEQEKKDISYFKQRAKKHARSEEGKAIRQKVIQKEMGTMGYEKKNTNRKQI